MPDFIYTGDIVVVGPHLPGLFWPWPSFFSDVYSQLPAQEKFIPQVANQSGVNVYYDGSPPVKPQLVQTAINRLSAAVDQIMNAVNALPDNKDIRISSTETIKASELKIRFGALKTIRVTETIYREGYGGLNWGPDGFEISSQTAAGWSSFGPGGTRFIILHELAHNSASGDAVRKQNQSANLASGGTRDSFKGQNQYFKKQEEMTNRLAMNIAEETGIDVTQTGNYGPYPVPGISAKSDL